MKREETQKIILDLQKIIGDKLNKAFAESLQTCNNANEKNKVIIFYYEALASVTESTIEALLNIK